MAYRVAINSDEFKMLFERIQKRFWDKIDYNEIAKNKSAFFGYDNKDPYPFPNVEDSLPEEESLKKSIVNDEDIAQYLTKHYKKVGKEEDYRYLYNGKHIYVLFSFFLDNKGNIKKENVTKRFEEPYLPVYLKYAGLDSYEELKNLVKDEQKSAAKKVEEIKLIGFHYSFSRHSIHRFKVKVRYNSDDTYDIEQQGFHNKKGTPPIYTATGCSIIEKKLHAELIHKETNDRLRIIINSGDNPFDKDLMLCAMLGISSRAGGEPLGVEGVLLKDDNALINDYELSIRRFLSLHRYGFKVSVGNISLNKLRAKNVDVNAISHMVGKWRVWRYNEKRKAIVQSVLHIENDYQVYCYNDDFSNEQKNNKIQVCLVQITIDNILKSRTICLTTHPYNGIDVIGTIMLKIPLQEIKKTNKTTSGTVSLIGREDGYPFSSRIAIWKDDDLTITGNNHRQIWEDLHTNNELKILTIKEAEAKKDTDFAPLWKEFFKT